MKVARETNFLTLKYIPFDCSLYILTKGMSLVTFHSTSSQQRLCFYLKKKIVLDQNRLETSVLN